MKACRRGIPGQGECFEQLLTRLMVEDLYMCALKLQQCSWLLSNPQTSRQPSVRLGHVASIHVQNATSATKAVRERTRSGTGCVVDHQHADRS